MITQSTMIYCQIFDFFPGEKSIFSLILLALPALHIPRSHNALSLLYLFSDGVYFSFII
jgi:hypothetical protein